MTPTSLLAVSIVVALLVLALLAGVLVYFSRTLGAIRDDIAKLAEAQTRNDAPELSADIV